MTVNFSRPFRSLIRAILAAGVLALGAATAPVAAAPDAPDSVTIAYQPGIGYANLIVIKEQRTLEKQFPKTTFTWKVLSNGAVIRDGIIANHIQIGAGGVGPFLIGWDRGVGYQLISALNEMDLWLVTRDASIHSLKDIKPGMQIGMPGPDSIQAIALRKGAEMQLGNAHALDSNIVAIAHPVGLQALEHGQLVLHLSSPPFEFEEVKDGGHIVFRSYQAFGPSTFNSVFSTTAFYNAYPKFVDVFYKDLQDATNYINHDTVGAAKLLSDDTAGKVSAAQFEGWMTHKEITYTTTPHGFGAYAKFMQSIGLLSKTPASMKDLELPTLAGTGS
ncbi:MAG: ABC transporter substrate-binding protein [Vulcanimicrobiaceae bacterium]